MKAFLLIFSLCLTSLCSPLAQAEATLASGLVNPGHEEKPVWFKNSFLDIREDITEVTAANKRVLLYFYQDGCPYCTKLLKTHFSDPAIAGKIQAGFEVIAINLWGDRSVTDLSGQEITEKVFAKGLRVQYTPTLLFLTEDGQVALRANGYYAQDKFVAALDYVSGKQEKAGGFRDFYAKRMTEGKSGQAAKPDSQSTPEIAESLPQPLHLADARKGSGRPLLVIVGQQADCEACGELYTILGRKEVAYSLSNLDVAQVDAQSADSLQTPDGQALKVADWLQQLDIEYTPSLVFFDNDGKEVFRTEAYLKAFHVHGALDYVVSGAYRWQPEFQRFLQHRTEVLRARGVEVDLME